MRSPRSLTLSDADAAERGREVVLGGLYCALGVAVPLMLHVVPGGGQVLLPMHWPVLLAGCLLSPAVAASVGLLTPWVSWLATGMPPWPFTLTMSAELAVLGGAAAWLTRRGLGLGWVVAGALIARGAVTWLLYTAVGPYLGLPARLTATAVVLTGLPGAVAQLVLVPMVARPARQRWLASRLLLARPARPLAD